MVFLSAVHKYYSIPCDDGVAGADALYLSVLVQCKYDVYVVCKLPEQFSVKFCGETKMQITSEAHCLKVSGVVTEDAAHL